MAEIPSKGIAWLVCYEIDHEGIQDMGLTVFFEKTTADSYAELCNERDAGEMSGSWRVVEIKVRSKEAVEYLRCSKSSQPTA